LRRASGRGILPKFLSVVDDPTIKEFDGKKLVGSYEVDSEGVPCATRDGGGRRDAAELFDWAAADPGLPCFERTRPGIAGDGSVPDDRDADLQEFGAGDGSGVEEKVDGDGWRAGQAVWIPRGYAWGQGS